MDPISDLHPDLLVIAHQPLLDILDHEDPLQASRILTREDVACTDTLGRAVFGQNLKDERSDDEGDDGEEEVKTEEKVKAALKGDKAQ